MVRSKIRVGDRAVESGRRVAARGSRRNGVGDPAAPATILHLIDTGGPGGAETIYGELASGLDTGRWRSVAAVPEKGWLWQSLRTRGVVPQLVPTGGSFDVGFVRRLGELVQKEQVDLVHAHLLTSGVYGGFVGRLRRVPVICTLHGEADFGPTVPLRGVKMRLLGAFATRVVAVSEPLRRLVVAAGVGAGRTEVIHNGIDIRAFSPGRDRSLRDELRIADDEVLVGAVGNVRPSKDYGVLLRTAARLRSSALRYRFVIVGDTSGSLFDELMRLRRELALEDIVTFTGFRPDVLRVMRNLDLFVITSSSEGFSLTTIQAMACGLPVVATRCGGPEEIIADGVTGMLVAARAPNGVAAAIQTLAADPERRARFGRAAHAMVQQRYTTEAMLDAYQALYQRWLGREKRWHRS